MLLTAPQLTDPTEPLNQKILEISEDQLSGFQEQPFHLIAQQAKLPLDLVLQRIRLMLNAGTIRRVRQTLLATKLAEGALVAWDLPDSRLVSAFRFLADQDPFSGHVVIRSTNSQLSGARYKLWTTLKVPQGQSLKKHASTLQQIIGAHSFQLMPANGVFSLGVGHMRRRKLPPGAKAPQPAQMSTTQNVVLSDAEWNTLLLLKDELSPQEIHPDPWEDRIKRSGLSRKQFFALAHQLDRKGVIGRFSTFLEHVKPTSSGQAVTRYNGLFHWAVPPGLEKKAGGEIGRHYCMTHCYWREGGPDFGNVNIMGVVHGTEKMTVLAHKKAIDEHLAQLSIPVTYSSVFWGGKSEIKPSEISPDVFRHWHATPPRPNSLPR